MGPATRPVTALNPKPCKLNPAGRTVPGLRREAELHEGRLVRLRLGIGTDDDPRGSLRSIAWEHDSDVRRNMPGRELGDGKINAVVARRPLNRCMPFIPIEGALSGPWKS